MVPSVQPERALALLYRTLYPCGSWNGAHPSDPLVITTVRPHSAIDAFVEYSFTCSCGHGRKQDLPNVTASAVGSSATFEVEIEGGTPPYIYEWFLSAPDAAAIVLPHCVGSRCTVSSLRMPDNGREVYCEIKGTEVSSDGSEDIANEPISRG